MNTDRCRAISTILSAPEKSVTDRIQLRKLVKRELPALLTSHRRAKHQRDLLAKRPQASRPEQREAKLAEREKRREQQGKREQKKEHLEKLLDKKFAS